MANSIEEFTALLPAHKASLHLTHNQHLAYYETVEQYLSDRDFSFQCDTDREESISSNEIWELQWYPDTPIGFYSIAAPTLGKLMAFAKVALDD